MAFKNTNARESSVKEDAQYADKLNDMIRKKAFELFQKRGSTSGRELDDWLEAERIVKRYMRIK